MTSAEGVFWHFRAITHLHTSLSSLAKVDKRIQYKLISLTHKVFITSQSFYLRYLISLQTARNTRSYDVVTPAHPFTTSSAKVFNMPRLAPASLHEQVSPLHAYLNPPFSSPLSPSIFTLSL